MITFLAFIFVFGLIVFAHEMGHFVSARIFGVKVKEFAFGFPPRIFSRVKNGTRYAINLIPVGGYVSLKGEDPEDKKDNNNLNSKKHWQRAIIFGSGVIMNMVLAWLLLTLFFAIGGKPILPDVWKHEEVNNNLSVVVNEVEKDSPAEEEGIEAGDVIKKVNGETIYMEQYVFSAVQESKIKDEDIVLTIERNSEKIDKTLRTYTDEVESRGEMVEVERVGIVMESRGDVSTAWYVAPWVALKELWRIIALSFQGFWVFISTLFADFQIADGVAGPVGIVVLTGTFAKMGFSALVQFVILLSIVIGVFNILPFPALDGGHIMLLGIEKITGKEIPQSTKDTINRIGFALLLLLVFAVTIKDIGTFDIF
jgi:regulator of sigma E protease